MTTIVCLSSLNCSETILLTIHLTYSSSSARTHFSGGAIWHWLMSTSNLKSFPMKKQWEHLVVKLFTILCNSPVSTSSPGFGMRSSGDAASSVITDVSRVLFEGVDWRLPDGVGVSLTAGVAVGVVLLESDGTGRGFLTVRGLEDPAPSSVVDFRLTGADFGLF